MSVRITRTVRYNTTAPANPLRDAERLAHGRSVTAAVFEVMRTAVDLAQQHVGTVWAGKYPDPDGAPWSERGVLPDTMCGPRTAHEVRCKVAAWNARLVGSRYQVTMETLDPGFTIEWTLEITETPSALAERLRTPWTIHRPGLAQVLLDARDELRDAHGSDWTFEAKYSAVYARPTQPGASAPSVAEILIEPDQAATPLAAPFGVHIDHGELGMQYLGYRAWPTATEAFDAALRGAERFGDELHNEGDHRLCG